MPEYVTNPLAGVNTGSSSLSSLADALGGSAEKMFKARIDADNARALQSQRYAAAGASNASARNANASAALSERELMLQQQLQQIWDPKVRMGDNPQADAEARILQSGALMMELGIDPGPVLPIMLQAGGLPDAYIERALVSLRGLTPGQTSAGLQAARDDELVEAMGPEGVPTLMRAGDAAGAPAIVSETEARGSTLAHSPLISEVDRRDLALGLMDPMTVIRDGKPATVTEADALHNPSLNPLVSETDAKGMSLLGLIDTPGAPSPGMGFEGTSMDAQSYNIVAKINEKLRRGEPITPEEYDYYASAWRVLHQSQSGVRPDGSTYTIEPTPLANFASPQEVAARAGVDMQGTAQPRLGGVEGPSMLDSYRLNPGSTGGVFTPGLRPSAGQQPRPPSPVPANGQPGGATRFQIGSNTITTTPGLEDKPPTEAQSRYGQYASRIQSGMLSLMNTLGYDFERGAFREGAWQPTLMGALKEELLPGVVSPYLQDEAHQLFYASAAQTLNPLIRADSGAAVPDSEYPRYYAQYIPRAGEPDSVKKLKLDHLMLTQLAFEEVANVHGKRQFDESELPQIQQELHAARERIGRELGMTVIDAVYGPNGPVVRGAIGPDGTYYNDLEQAPVNPSGALGSSAPPSLTAPSGSATFLGEETQ